MIKEISISFIRSTEYLIFV